MEAVQERGLTRHNGVSIVSSAKLNDLLAHCRRRPEVNQVERHPLLLQPQLLADCATALKGADEPVLLDNPVIGATPRNSAAAPPRC